MTTIRFKLPEHKDIDKIMNSIPEKWRNKWCGGEDGLCACLGCVQIGNRIIMVEKATGIDYKGDPEYIDERKIPKEIYVKYKITRKEWEEWKLEQRDKTITLLEKYSVFLAEHGYLDEDWRSEEPYAIDEFLKLTDK